jgi:hypothetical protein
LIKNILILHLNDFFILDELYGINNI